MAIPSVPPSLVTVRADGLVDAWLVSDNIEPRWATASRVKLEDVGLPLQSLGRRDLNVRHDIESLITMGSL